jgi:AcrR family transcriptional regulator
VAASSFRERGYSATTTRELATAVGLQKASLYHYISDKADLLYDICEASLARIYSAGETALADHCDPIDGIERLIAAHVGTMLRDRDMHATMFIELRSLTGDRRDEIVRLRDRYEALVCEAIANGQAVGTLRQDFTPRALNLALLNLPNWTIFWYDPSGPLSPDRLARDFAEIFLSGARRNAGENQAGV